MKFRKKSDVVEAVKWDGNIETINSNTWLEDAIKEDKAMLAMNDIHDKEPVLLIPYSNGNELMVVKVGNYIFKREHEGSYIIDSLSADKFEKHFEVVEDNKSIVNNCISIDLELNKKEFDKQMIDILKPIKMLNENGIRFVSRDQFILEQISIKKEEAIDRFNSISKGYNFILSSEVDGDVMYYGVEYINEKLGRE